MCSFAVLCLKCILSRAPMCLEYLFEKIIHAQNDEKKHNSISRCFSKFALSIFFSCEFLQSSLFVFGFCSRMNANYFIINYYQLESLFGCHFNFRVPTLHNICVFFFLSSLCSLLGRSMVSSYLWCLNFLLSHRPSTRARRGWEGGKAPKINIFPS